jgi:uncharacterized protein YbcI
MNTQGEAEGQISSNFSRFYSEIFGRGPKSIRVNSVNSMVVVISQNLLTSAEKLLVSSSTGCKMVKEVRQSLIDCREKELVNIISDATGETIHNVHHDFSTTDGEESFVFSLDGVPVYRLNNNGKKAGAIY